MKILFHIIALVIFLNTAQAQSPFSSKSWQKNWSAFSESKWMMKTEVSNAEYKLFLKALQQAGKVEEVEFYYPDSLGWQRIGEGMGPYVSFYFSNAAFNNYPVVNISFEAAYDYCMWLNEEYKKLKRKPFGEVVFRIPTREEWMLAARSGKEDGREYPWNGMYLHNNRRERLCNFKPEQGEVDYGNAGDLKQAAFITAPVNAFFPNDIGLYNSSGNVAEMVAERGVAVGGSFLDTGYGVRISSKRNFEKSAADIGFRVMMVRAN